MTSKSAGRRPPVALRCSECGASAAQWVGRCPECQAWGTIAEAGGPIGPLIVAPGPVTAPARPIAELDPMQAQARPTGVDEFDRVLGGGLVPGSVLLLAGEPGVGKSTLLLEVAHHYARREGRPALIVTGEESTAQVRMRAERTGAIDPGLYLAAENDLSAVLTHVDHVSPGLLVIDSIQTITSSAVDSGAGGVTQIRAAAGALISLAKQRGIATVLVGHVTKDGAVAGPRALEHLVDVVLHFEGDRHSSLRLIRATKNRFGAVDEIGCFEMREDGIVGLPDPSGLNLSDRPAGVRGTCVGVVLEGRRPLVTEIQAMTNPTEGFGSPRRSLSGLDGARVAMLLAALHRHAGLSLAEFDVYVATVGGIAATEPAADLAIALAIGSDRSDFALPPGLCAIGEVSLSGDVRRVSSLEQRLGDAARLGFHTALVPPAASEGKGLPEVPGIRCIPVPTLLDAVALALRPDSAASAPRRASIRVVPSGLRLAPSLTGPAK
jgi:DNA repair protein RadA/Sms